MSNELLNPVLARWLDLREGEVPTDLDCVGCSRALAEPQWASRWRDYKCCAFQPYVANFLCGAWLEAGIPLVERFDRYALRPLGLIPLHAFRVKCDSVPDEQRTAEHLCSFYAEGRCSIWNFRPGECSTYFCTKRLGTASERAFQLESGLAQMALAHLGFSAREIAEEVDALNAPPANLRSLTLTEAREIFLACWGFAKTQTRNDVASWLSSL